MVGGIEGSIYGIAGVRVNMPDADHVIPAFAGMT